MATSPIFIVGEFTADNILLVEASKNKQEKASSYLLASTDKISPAVMNYSLCIVDYYIL